MKSSLKPMLAKLALLSLLVCIAIAAPLLPITKAKKEANASSAALKNSRLVNMATLQDEKKGDTGSTTKTGGNENKSSEVFEITVPTPKKPLPGSGTGKVGAPPRIVSTVDAGQEVEPNGTSATATPLGGTDVKIKGNVFPNGDVDFYSFTAAAGDRVYAAVMTSFSGSASVDSFLDVIASDGATVLESDDNDGSFGSTSSGIAGTTLATAGTYFLRVRHLSATGQLRPYDLYVRVQSGAPTPETESNDTFPGQALPASGWVSGSTSATTDIDFYSIALNAGDTVYLSLDLDPERDTTEWNGQLGLGAFGTPPLILVVNDAGTATPDSESFFMTVKAAGTYGIFVGLPTGGTTFGTYNLSVSVLPRVNRGINCTTYTSTDVPVAISSGAPPITVTSTLTIPGNPRIENLRVNLNLTHNFMADLDVELTSPTGNTVVLFNDVGSVTTGAQTTMDVTLDDYAAIPIGQFTIVQGLTFLPELNFRLDWFKGQPAGGTWTLTIRDDATADGGSLTGWSLEICEPPAAPACGAGSPTTVFTTDFESGAAGFTHSGAADEWELGLPTFAPITTCNSGVNCWKTDLDNTYNASSNQELLSPNISLAGISGPIILSWAQKFQIESATFDHAFVDVREVGNPTNAKRVFEWLGATMTPTGGSTPTVTIQEAAGWGIYTADISSFAGLNIEVVFHLDGDTTVQLGGLAIDDVSVIGCGAGGGCVVTCPANVTQTNDANQCGAVVTYLAPTTTGSCGTVSCSPASGSFFPVGTTTVTCTEAVIPRGTGGSATCTFTVTVTDDQAPSITCPANITTVNDANQCGAVVAYPAPTVTDNCPGTFTATCTPASGSFFPVGTTTVTCEVDAPPNRAAAPAGACMPVTITHSSSQAIVPSNSVACTNNLGFTTANSYWRAFSLPAFSIPTAFDVLSVDIAIEEATAGAVAAPKKGSAAPPTGKGGKTPVQPRSFSKKQGTSVPKGGSQPVTVNIYQSSTAFPTGFPGSLTLIGTATVMVADQTGTILNVPITGTVAAGGELVVEVAVPDGITAGNTFFIGSNTAAETGPSYLNAADCGITNPTTTAALGFPDMHVVMNVNGCPQGGGGGSSCTFTVTVNDTQPPTITCPTDVTAVTPACGGTTSVVNYPAPTAADNCPGVTTACVPPSGSVFAIGVTTVTCTATDGSGNTATCSFMVTLFNACLQDDTNPNTVLLWNTATGAYRFCCNGSVFTGVGVVLNQDQSHSINHAPVDKRIQGVLDCSTGRGEGGLQSNAGSLICTINDRNITNNTCSCGGAMALPGTTTKQ